MSNITRDVSKLTTIPYATLNKLRDIEIACIGHNVYEGILKNEQQVTIDIGIGELVVKINPEEIRYKFIPSSYLEETVRTSVVNKESPLVQKIEGKLRDKVMNVYKELL